MDGDSLSQMKNALVSDHCCTIVTNGSSVVRSVDEVREQSERQHAADDEKRDGNPERHQKALPMNGSMCPQYSTATQMKMADAAAIFGPAGALTPDPIHVSSTSMK